MSPIRVLFADDHPVLRAGLRSLISSQQDMVVVAEAEDGRSAIALAKSEQPDIAILDLTMAVVGGAEATARIVRDCPGVRVLALTAHEDAGYADLMLSAGAAGFVLKRSASQELLRAIRTVAAGERYLDPSVAPQINSDEAPRTIVEFTDRELSEREAEVLRLIAQGHTIKGIAEVLKVGPRTVETYKARAMDKLQLKSRADTVRYALQRGWLGRD